MSIGEVNLKSPSGHQTDMCIVYKEGTIFYKRDQLENNLLILGEQDSQMGFQWLAIGVK